MQIWSGFKTSAYKYQSGCALIIDNCCRFMSTKTVLDKIHDIFDMISQEYDEGSRDFIEAFQSATRKELINQSVIANYANKKNYIVKDVRFDLGPCQTFFELKDGTKISVAKYFYRTYELKITDKRQPMLIMS